MYPGTGHTEGNVPIKLRGSTRLKCLLFSFRGKKKKGGGEGVLLGLLNVGSANRH